MEATLQSIFCSEFKSYRKMHGLSIDQVKAAQAIMYCKHDELGYEEWQCTNDNYVKRENHSCRHRSCPQCNGSHRHDWLEKIKAKLLPCDHYHVVFTLPHELNDIWHYNRCWCTEKLFQATSETLRELLSDERYLGGEVGLLSSLHTWSRTLIFHPHMHVLVTGVGLRNSKLCRLEKDFLVPVGVLKAKFKGKWLSWLNRGYDKGEIRLPNGWTEPDWRRLLRKIARQCWNIRVQGAYKHGDGVAVYLSRYVRGGPIRDSKVVSATSENVSFQYRDHRDKTTKLLKLKTEHFMTRILWHVSVKGQHLVRYYGLYSSGAREKRDHARMDLGEELETTYLKEDRELPLCPVCGHFLMHTKSARREISYIGSSHVQQAVTADRDRPEISMGRYFIDKSPPFFFAAKRPLN